MFCRYAIRFEFGLVAVAAGFGLGQTPAMAGDPWADGVFDYIAGDNGAPDYSDPSVALGSPERDTGESAGFASPVTPFNPAWRPDEIVSVGPGGALTVRFNEPVVDAASHPFGVDLIVFGNGQFIDGPNFDGTVSGLFADGPMQISVSADGANFVALPGAYDDAMFPALGYLDLDGPYATQPGTVASDFRRPIDPSLTLDDLLGKSFAELVALYAGSGGGIPIDIAASGLYEVSYVRVAVGDGASSVEIDAFSAVPEPGAALALVFLAVCWCTGRRSPGAPPYDVSDDCPVAVHQ